MSWASSVVGETFVSSVTIKNTGDRDGRHVAQIYATTDEDGRTVRHLLGFQPIDVPAGATATVAVECSTRPLQRWTGDGFSDDLSGTMIEASAFSGDPRSARTVLREE